MAYYDHAFIKAYNQKGDRDPSESKSNGPSSEKNMFHGVGEPESPSPAPEEAKRSLPDSEETLPEPDRKILDERPGAPSPSSYYQHAFQVEKTREETAASSVGGRGEIPPLTKAEEIWEEGCDSIRDSVRKIKTVEGPFFSRMPSPSSSLVGAFAKQEGSLHEDDRFYRKAKRSARVEEYRRAVRRNAAEEASGGAQKRQLPLPPKPDEVDEEISQAMRNAKRVIHKQPRCSFQGADAFQRKHGSMMGPEKTLCDSFNNATTPPQGMDSPSSQPLEQNRREPLLGKEAGEEGTPAPAPKEQETLNVKRRWDQPHTSTEELRSKVKDSILGDLFEGFSLSGNGSESREAPPRNEERISSTREAETPERETENPEPSLPEDKASAEEEVTSVKDSPEESPTAMESPAEDAQAESIAEETSEGAAVEEAASEEDDRGKQTEHPTEIPKAKPEVIDESQCSADEEEPQKIHQTEHETPCRTAEEFEKTSWPNHCVRLGEVASEQMHRLADRLKEKMQKGHKIVAIAGCSAGDGCTTLLLCAAREMARRDIRTILVDGNFENPQLADLFQRTPECGWEEVLQGNATLDEAVLSCGEPSISILPLMPSERKTAYTSSWNANPSTCMRALSRHFDLVLIDAGKLNGRLEGEQIDDLLRFGADGVVVVHNVHTTPEPHLRYVREKMQSSGLVELGIAENFV